MSFSRVIVRSLCSSSAAQKMIKPPVQVFGVEGRYASALYSAASKQKSLNNVEKDLIKLEGMMKTDQQLAEFVKNPSVKRKDKAEAMITVGKKMSLSKETTNLLSLLAENGRLPRITNVISIFKMLMTVSRGEVSCEVITAKPLNAEMKSQLEATLKKFLNKDQSILLSTKIDPSIIGGMIVSIGDRYVDMSIITKVKKYSEIIANTV